MKESEAWRRIATKIASGRWDKNGVCTEIHSLYNKALIGYDTRQVMEIRIWDHSVLAARRDKTFNRAYYLHDETVGDYFLVGGEKQSSPNLRILACLMLALECEDEENGTTPTKRKRA